MEIYYISMCRNEQLEIEIYIIDRSIQKWDIFKNKSNKILIFYATLFQSLVDTVIEIDDIGIVRHVEQLNQIQNPNKVTLLCSVDFKKNVSILIS